MADSTINDIAKMKVVDLRKELKARGLSYAGDKKELVARLQTASAQDDHADINLDSDEIDSDGVLDDEDDKTHGDILDDPTADTLNDDLALEENSPEKLTVEKKPQRILKRKITAESQKEPPAENKDASSKKIVLNRTISMTSNTSKPVEKATENTSKTESDTASESDKIKITSDLDLKTRLEMRAKRFGLPPKISDEARKEARKQRFGQGSNSISEATKVTIPGTLSDTLDKLKKRSERFGQSVSSLMIDIENKEKLEKRKAKFGTVK